MYIKSLMLRGFKTFADKTEILLEPTGGVTAIVGPNGCGKSNIVDAIRWVLGEQSSKALRTEALEEVIFAGSTARNPLSMAEVTLLLENSDSLLPIEFSEVAIKRRVFRDCESEFFINRAPCRLKDIKDLFLDTGLGGGTYSIISQGQVDAVLSSRPEDRRAIFSEAAGINKYKTRKGAAERKLIAAEQNLLRVSDLRGEIAGRLEILKEQAARAQAYLEIKNKVKELEIGLSKKQLGKFLEKKLELQNKINELRQRAVASQDGLKKTEEKKIGLRAQIRQLEAEERDRRVQLVGEIDHDLKLQIMEASARLVEQRNALRDLEEKMRFAAFEMERNQKIEASQRERGALLDCEIPGVTHFIEETRRKLEEIKSRTAAGILEKKAFEVEEAHILESILALVKDIHTKARALADEIAEKLLVESDRPPERGATIMRLGERMGGFLQELAEGSQALEQLIARKLKFKTVADEEAGSMADLRVALAGSEEKLKNLSGESQKIKQELATLQRSCTLRRAEAEQFAKEKEQLVEVIRQAAAEVENLNSKLLQDRALVNQQLEELAKKREEMERQLDELDLLAAGEGEANLGEELMRAEITLAKLEGENQAVEDKLLEEYSLTVEQAFATDFEVGSLSAAKEEVMNLRLQLRELEPVNLLAIDEYKNIEERVRFIDEQFADLTLSRENLKNLIVELDARAQESFLRTVEAVNKNFQEIFAGLFEGGEAKIVLGEGADVLSAGIEIIARPHGRKWLNLSLLSGGEKSLTAIAILFSLLKTHPSPFCFLDEVDAALDEANVQRFSTMLMEFAKTIQMVVITHNRRTMEAADVIYGITMEEFGISKVISMKLSAVAA